MSQRLTHPSTEKFELENDYMNSEHVISLKFLRDKAHQLYLPSQTKTRRNRFVHQVLDKLEHGSLAQSEWKSFHTPAVQKPKWLNYHAGVKGGALDAFLVDLDNDNPMCFLLDLQTGGKVANVIKHKENVRVGRNGNIICSSSRNGEVPHHTEIMNEEKKELTSSIGHISSSNNMRCSLSWKQELEKFKDSVYTIPSASKDKIKESRHAQSSSHLASASRENPKFFHQKIQRSVSAPSFKTEDGNSHFLSHKTKVPFRLQARPCTSQKTLHNYIVAKHTSFTGKPLRKTESFPAQGQEQTFYPSKLYNSWTSVEEKHEDSNSVVSLKPAIAAHRLAENHVATDQNHVSKGKETYVGSFERASMYSQKKDLGNPDSFKPIFIRDSSQVNLGLKSPPVEKSTQQLKKEIRQYVEAARTEIDKEMSGLKLSFEESGLL